MKKKILCGTGVLALLVLAMLLARGSRDGGTDFTGMDRLRYPEDTAYRFCRELEREIGIQIFYLPEWTEKEDGILHYSDLEGFAFDKAYFQLVLEELKKMRAAFALYPKGFLREVVQKRGERGVEIILCPYTYKGMASYGVHVYDYSDDGEKIDQVYYTGIGDVQYYGHEMGHMVMTSAAIRSGWRETCDAWDAVNAGTGDYISDYARTNRAEDWAETWAFLWHQPGEVASRLAAGGDGLREKVRMVYTLLTENYETAQGDALPWRGLLDG